MLKLSILELIFRALPEEIILIFSIYVFSFTRIDIKKLITSGVIFSIMVYLIRLLPIQPGVHSLLLIPIIVLLTTIINKINMIKATSASILSIILMYLCEMINSYILTDFLHLNIEEAFQNIVAKILYSSISLAIYLAITLLIYFTIYKNKKR